MHIYVWVGLFSYLDQLITKIKEKKKKKYRQVGLGTMGLTYPLTSLPCQRALDVINMFIISYKTGEQSFDVGLLNVTSDAGGEGYGTGIVGEGTIICSEYGESAREAKEAEKQAPE